MAGSGDGGGVGVRVGVNGAQLWGQTAVATFSVSWFTVSSQSS